MEEDDPKTVEQLIHSYVDDMLPPRERLEFEEFLAANPAVMERVRIYQRQNSELHAAYDRYLGAELPPETVKLGNRLRHRLAPRGQGGRSGRITVAALAFLVVGAGAGLYAFDGLRTQPGTHLATLFERGSDLLSQFGLAGGDGNVRSLQQARIAAARAVDNFSAPDLDDYGFQLVASRIITAKSGADTIQMTYESKDRGNLLLYFTPHAAEARGDHRISLNREGAVSILTWSDSTRSYNMISESLEREAMLAIGKAVIGRLSKPMPSASPDAGPVAPEAKALPSSEQVTEAAAQGGKT